MTNRFRKVDPLYLYADETPHAEVDAKAFPRYIWINMENMVWTVKEATALRDWLTSALPKDSKP